MQIIGNVVVVCPVKTGVSQSGKEWASMDFVVEIPGQYPKRVSFNIFGQDKINQLNPQVGEQVTVDFDIDAHEYNGRWFNQVGAWKITRQGQNVQNQGAPNPMNPNNSFPPRQDPPQPQGNADSLPF